MKRETLRILLIPILALVVAVAYWAALLNAQRSQENYAETQVRARTLRLAEAMAVQVDTLFSGLSYLNSSLAAKYLVDPDEYFKLSVQTALNTFPQDSLAQIAVADASGTVVYSSLEEEGSGKIQTARVSIADREHFLVHARRQDSGTYVGYPVFGRLSQRWTIQMSYPLRRQGEFLGVVVLSVSPDYISGYFRELFSGVNDVASLLYQDGTYLARSRLQDQVINQKVPDGRNFLQQPDVLAGEYLAKPVLDPIERFYAWHRVSNFPLVVIIGLGRDEALSTTKQLQRDSLLRNALGTVLLLALMSWVALLFCRQRRDRQRLAESEQRLKLALKGGDLGTWDWNLQQRTFHYDEAWGAMVGYAPGELAPDQEGFLELVHPDDRQIMLDKIAHHLRGDRSILMLEHRLRHRDGHWVWISARGSVTDWSPDDQPMRVAGTQTDISARRAEARLREALFDNSAAIIFLTDPEPRRFLAANRRAVRTFLSEGESLTGMSLSRIHVDDTYYHQFAQYYPALRAQGRIQVEWPFLDCNRQVRWFSVLGTLLDPAVPEGAAIWTLLDITQRRQVEQGLADTRTRLTEVIQHFSGGVVVEDESGLVLLNNRKFCELLGLACGAQVLVGTRLDHIPEQIGGPAASLLRDMFEALSLQAGVDLERELICDDRVLQVSVTAIARDSENLGRLWIFQDVTARRRHESELNRRASTDSLTGLANRAVFLTRLEQAIAAPETPDQPAQGIVLMADLDHFKRVNDTYGHAAGDEVLRFLARLFLTTLRKDDLVGRIGGEEFAVLLPGAGDSEGRALAERVRKALENSEIHTSTGQVRITLSIGMARIAAGETAETLLAAADAALYKAKRSGRNRVVVAWED